MCENLIKLQETLASDDDVVHASTQFGNSSSPLNQAMDELEPLEASDPDLLFPYVIFSFNITAFTIQFPQDVRYDKC